MRGIRQTIRTGPFPVWIARTKGTTETTGENVNSGGKMRKLASTDGAKIQPGRG